MKASHLVLVRTGLSEGIGLGEGDAGCDASREIKIRASSIGSLAVDRLGTSGSAAGYQLAGAARPCVGAPIFDVTPGT